MIVNAKLRKVDLAKIDSLAHLWIIICVSRPTHTYDGFEPEHEKRRQILYKHFQNTIWSPLMICCWKRLKLNSADINVGNFLCIATHWYRVQKIIDNLIESNACLETKTIEQINARECAWQTGRSRWSGQSVHTLIQHHCIHPEWHALEKCTPPEYHREQKSTRTSILRSIVEERRKYVTRSNSGLNLKGTEIHWLKTMETCEMYTLLNTNNSNN